MAGKRKPKTGEVLGGSVVFLVVYMQIICDYMDYMDSKQSRIIYKFS